GHKCASEVVCLLCLCVFGVCVCESVCVCVCVCVCLLSLCVSGACVCVCVGRVCVCVCVCVGGGIVEARHSGAPCVEEEIQQWIWSQGFWCTHEGSYAAGSQEARVYEHVCVCVCVCVCVSCERCYNDKPRHMAVYLASHLPWHSLSPLPPHPPCRRKCQCPLCRERGREKERERERGDRESTRRDSSH